MTSTFWFTPVFILIWSTGFIIARYGMPYSEPMTFLAIRFGAVVLCMIPIVLWLKAPWPRGRQIWHIAIAGALFQFGYLGGVWAAVSVSPMKYHVSTFSPPSRSKKTAL
jgi:drug/metabolite transporter (DMT)-like permease